jgi:hypothetical protein
MQKNNLTLAQRIFPGVIALFVLLIYYIQTGQLSEYYPWLGETLVVYASWFFFMRVIVRTIIDRHFDRSFTIPMLIGAFALITSILIFNMTVEDIFLKLVHATIIWSLIYTIYGYVKEKVGNHG